MIMADRKNIFVRNNWPNWRKNQSEMTYRKKKQEKVADR